MKKPLLITFLFVYLFCNSSMVFSNGHLLQSADYLIEKEVGNDWVWFSDYAFVYSKWTVGCQPGCTCKVGMGVKAFGKPRGERKTFTDVITVLTVGLGAIHVQKVEGASPTCKVVVAPSGDPKLFDIVKGKF